MRMCHVTWPGGRGHPKPHIWNKRPQFAYSLYNFYGATTTIKGSLHGSTPIVKRFSAQNCPVKSGPKNGSFSRITGINVKVLFSNPEKAYPARNHVVWRILCENRFRALGCRPFEEPGKKKPSKHLWWPISRIRGKETAWAIVTKFCMLVEIGDIITYELLVTIGYGVWAWQGVEFPISPLTCVVALTTLALAARVRDNSKLRSSILTRVVL